MDFDCPSCRSAFKNVPSEQAGTPARCEECGKHFIIPFEVAEELFEWARPAPWEVLAEGLRTEAARLVGRRAVDMFVRIFEKRREEAIWKQERAENK